MANVAEVAVALCGRPRYPTLAAVLAVVASATVLITTPPVPLHSNSRLALVTVVAILLPIMVSCSVSNSTAVIPAVAVLTSGPLTVKPLPTTVVDVAPPMLMAVALLPVAMLRVPVVRPVNTFIIPVVTVDVIESVPLLEPPATVRVFVFALLPKVQVVAAAAFEATLIVVATPNSLTVVATVLYKFCVTLEPITVGALSVVIAPAPVDPIASVVAAVANDMFVEVDVNKLTVAEPL